MIDPIAEMERIKAACSERQISQRALAIQAGMDPSVLNRIWKGRRPVSLKMINRLDAALASVPGPLMRPASAVDPEFACMQALADLPYDARGRVLAWAAARWP